MDLPPVKVRARDILFKFFTCSNIKSQCCERNTITNNTTTIGKSPSFEKRLCDLEKKILCVQDNKT